MLNLCVVILVDLLLVPLHFFPFRGNFNLHPLKVGTSVKQSLSYLNLLCTIFSHLFYILKPFYIVSWQLGAILVAHHWWRCKVILDFFGLASLLQQPKATFIVLVRKVRMLPLWICFAQFLSQMNYTKSLPVFWWIVLSLLWLNWLAWCNVLLFLAEVLKTILCITFISKSFTTLYFGEVLKTILYNLVNPLYSSKSFV